MICRRAGLIDRRAGYLGLEPAKNSGQAANPEHSQNLSQSTALDQVGGDLKNVVNGRPVQALEEQRDKPADRGGLDRGVRVQSRLGRH